MLVLYVLIGLKQHVIYRNISKWYMKDSDTSVYIATKNSRIHLLDPIISSKATQKMQNYNFQ